MEIFTLAVEDDDAGTRIDVYIAENVEELSRNNVQKLLNNGCILVNGNPCKANYKVRIKDRLDISIPEPESIEIPPENIPLDILYEDKDVIIINKPQGMVVHPAPGHYTGTLVNALMYHCGEELSGINGVMRPGIVHRIDKDTSGIIMAAKTNIAHQSLAEQLAEHSIVRKYSAIVFHNIKEDIGTVNKPIGRHPDDRKKMSVQTKKGKHAVTHYQVLERLKGFTWIEAQLETGRTHQIRVHMSAIGHPLLGDPVYGPKKQPFHLAGQALHAQVLGFNHPVTKTYMEFSAELPPYFQEVLKKLGVSQI